jgi:hypothetical protein
MPRITTHAISLDTVRRASKAMVDELTDLLQVPREHFAIEVCEHPFVLDGEVVHSHPFVEVALFDRGAKAEEGVARIITRHLRDAGCGSVDLYLVRLERHRYFEDGEPF